MRLHEFAKELKISNQQLIDRLKGLNIKVASHMSTLDASVVNKLRKKTDKPQSKRDKVSKPVKVAKEKTQKIEIKPPKVEKASPKAVASEVIAKEKVSKPAVVIKERKLKAKLEEVKVENIEPKKVTPEVVISAQQEVKAMPIIKEKKRPIRPEEVKTVKVEPPAVTIEAVALKEVQVKFPVNVKELAVKLQKKPSDIIKRLMELRVFANINQALSEEVAGKVVQGFGYALKKLPSEEEALIAAHTQQEDKAFLKSRPPVVTFMGHVDHGKTSLLDLIRKSKVAEQEHGGITQHIGAYKVVLDKGQITFLDTPGHEAFTAMRARGANITDIVVLVVAADEGIMPQTVEAIDHAKAAGVPIVVAMNKIDKPQADVDRIKKQLSELGLIPEDWGGKTITVGVSAKTGEGIDKLLEMVLLEAEMLELKANFERQATGVVVEARLTKGKGPVATVIVQNGTLKQGDVIIVGSLCARIRAMLDDHERMVQSVSPATPVEILGLPSVPQAGEQFYVVDDEKKAKEIVANRHDIERQKQMAPVARISLEELYSKIKEGQIKELNIVLKADVQGSLEALQDSLNKISTDEVKLNIIHSGIGAINTSDVILAVASAAVIIGFHIDVAPEAQGQIEKEGVDVRIYRIIYDAINEVKAALEGLLEPKLKKKFLGRIEIRTVFKLSKYGVIAGSFVQKGKINRQAEVSLIRNGEVVYEGKVASLKRFKDDVREVAEGFECGIGLSNFEDIKEGDIIEAFEIEKIARKL